MCSVHCMLRTVRAACLTGIILFNLYNQPAYIHVIIPISGSKTQVTRDEELSQGCGKWQSWSSDTMNL